MSELESLDWLVTIIFEAKWLRQVYDAHTDPFNSEIVEIKADFIS